jgi:hemerythrin-like metal-binding protein
MNKINWKSGYILGIEDMDNQHLFFSRLINRLSDELRDLYSIEHGTSIINELDAYTRFHFISEENIMRRTGYAGLEEHKLLHLKLIDDLGAKSGFLYLEPSQKRVEEIIVFLIKWFLQHTLHDDRLFADYIIRKGITV